MRLERDHRLAEGPRGVGALALGAAAVEQPGGEDDGVRLALPGHRADGGGEGRALRAGVMLEVQRAGGRRVGGEAPGDAAQHRERQFGIGAAGPDLVVEDAVAEARAVILDLEIDARGRLKRTEPLVKGPQCRPQRGGERHRAAQHAQIGEVHRLSRAPDRQRIERACGNRLEARHEIGQPHRRRRLGAALGCAAPDHRQRPRDDPRSLHPSRLHSPRGTSIAAILALRQPASLKPRAPAPIERKTT